MQINSDIYVSMYDSVPKDIDVIFYDNIRSFWVFDHISWIFPT